MSLKDTTALTAPRPTDDYDVAGWAAYYAANPGMRRSVGAEGDDNPPVDISDPAVKAFVEGLVEESVKGLKAKNSELIEREKKAKAASDELAKKLEAFDGVDLEDYKAFQTRVENDEDLKLIKEGKLDEVIERKTQKHIDAANKRLEEAEEKAAAAEKLADERDKALRTEKLNNQVATKVTGLAANALGDVQRLAGEFFDIGEDGKPVVRDGVEARTADGKPVAFDSFQNYLVENRPYYFTKGSGAGSQGGGKGGDGKPALQIPHSDSAAKSANIEEIASGKAEVT